MQPQQIRTSFVDFFVARDHKLVPPASLIPDAMSTTMFTIAGMEQFVPAFLGVEPPPAPRVVTVQRCLRVAGGKSDIDNVGRSGRHGTLLEMLGNFSFGAYYKREAIAYAWEYLTQVLRLPPQRLRVSVYVDDDEAADIWRRDIGLGPERITRLREDNFWDMGPTGPCGPCSEIFYDVGEKIGCGRADCGVGCAHCNRYIEFWNLVFQQFDRATDGALHPLPVRAIDTGMGFERLCMIMAGATSIFDTPLYQSIITALPRPTERSPLSVEEQAVHQRIIADHARATVFLAADGVTPSNNDRGYVMRFLMRRALRSGRRLRLPNGFLSSVVDAVNQSLADAYPQLLEVATSTKDLFAEEERIFDDTLVRGESRLAAIIKTAKASGASTIDGKAVFELHDTYGFPPELTAEIAREQDLEADMAAYRAAMEEQRRRARLDAQKKRADVRVASGDRIDVPDSEFVGYEQLEAASRIAALFDERGSAIRTLEQGQSGIVVLHQTPFYAERGGQMGDRGVIARHDTTFRVVDTQYQDKSFQHVLHRGSMERGRLEAGDDVEAIVDPVWRREIRRHHTVTHLLQRALKDVVGESVAQRGSAVFPDRTRFDFEAPHGALKAEEERQVQARVNELIRSDFHRDVHIMPFAQAVTRGAIYMKGEQYGDTVRVVTFGPSVELCGGTHVESTGEIGFFVLTTESAIAAGIRRVEGVVSQAADDFVASVRGQVQQAGAVLKAPADKLVETLERLGVERREHEERIAALEAQLAQAQAERLVADAKDINGISYLTVHADNAAQVKTLMDATRARFGTGVLAVAGASNGKVSAIVSVSDDLVRRGISASEILSAMMTHIEGRGGGSASLAQGGGKNAAGIDAALAAVPAAIQNANA